MSTPPAPLSVRRAGDDELSTIGAVTGDAYAADGLFAHESGYEADVRDAHSRHADGEIWVAEVEGVVVGSVTYCPPGSFHRELARDDEGEFRMLAVSPAARRGGIGQALVEKCIERAREEGLRAIVICSMREMTSAHRLYDRMGFVRDPDLDWSPAVNVILLAFRLPLRAE